MEDQSTDTSSEMDTNGSVGIKDYDRTTMRVERSADEQIRMECLQLAIRGREGHAPDKVLNIARDFEKFVKGNS